MAFARHGKRGAGKESSPEKRLKGEKGSKGKRRRCGLCESVPEEVLAGVGSAWIEGKPAHEISELFKLPLDLVEEHIHVCLMTRHMSRYKRVGHAFDLLWQAIDTAHQTYMDDPSMYHATGYQGLLKQLRALMVDLDNVQNSEELAADITQYALNPLVTSLTNALISEAGSLKEDLTARFDESEAERLTGDFLRRIAQHFTEASRTAHERVLDTLSARDQNRNKASGGPGRPRKPKGKHANLRAVS